MPSYSIIPIALNKSTHHTSPNIHHLSPLVNTIHQIKKTISAPISRKTYLDRNDTEEKARAQQIIIAGNSRHDQGQRYLLY